MNLSGARTGRRQGPLTGGRVVRYLATTRRRRAAGLALGLRFGARPPPQSAGRRGHAFRRLSAYVPRTTWLLLPAAAGAGRAGRPGHRRAENRRPGRPRLDGRALGRGGHRRGRDRSRRAATGAAPAAAAGGAALVLFGVLSQLGAVHPVSWPRV